MAGMPREAMGGMGVTWSILLKFIKLVDASGRNGCICQKDWNALGVTLLSTSNESLLDSG